ncbi:phage tail protein [Cupriavidus basilensis]|uniref:Phage tail protein n=1 Tax=Cupriavidus basilensis TaxID=68895 RepID=A0ABT6AX03_9BURK|nr:phage tail protein [Cupriavidus basilensis]MDF3837152.1 phage tail protein [Cupriavidus basilensis]
MTVRLPNGAIFSIASAYGAPKQISALSNAKPPVATADAHGLLDGAIVEVMSGWPGLDGRVARVDAVDVGSFALEGLDTTDATRYPAGAGIGSVRPVTTWQPITRVLEASMSGGDQQFYNYGFLEDTGDEKQVPTTRSARSIGLSLSDDDSLPHFSILRQADEDRLPRAIRFQLPSGGVIYYVAYVSLSTMPTITKNQAMARQLTLSMLGQPTRYSA